MDDRSSHARRPSDLEPHEMGVAGWFEKLERPDAPLGVLSAIRAGTTATQPRAGFLRSIPFGAWGLASAALLLLALGSAAYVELSSPVTIPAAADTAATSMDDLTIVDDSRMTLFHKAETFDDVGLARGHLIADWGR